MGRFSREAKAKEAKSWPRAREEGRKRYSSPERNNEDRNTCKQFVPGGVLELCPLTKPRRFPIQLLCISDLTAPPPLSLINYLHLKSSIMKQKMVKYLPFCPVAVSSLEGKTEVVFVRNGFSLAWPHRNSDASKHLGSF